MIMPPPMPDDNTILGSGKLPGPLLDRLIESYRTRPDESVQVTPGYGRDASAIDVGGPSPLIVKSDPITFATAAAARYLVAVNGNDIACMGGIPRWFSVVLLLPQGSTTEHGVESLFRELQEACDAANVSLIGGHTEITDAVTRPVFIGTMLGLVGQHGLLKPGSASEGDDLWLTKWVGIEGTALLARERTAELRPVLGDAVVSRAAKLLRHPGISIARDAALVLDSNCVTALHDPTEGGVATAIHEIASASACGAEILAEAVPILPETTAICNHFGIDPLGLISSGALLVATSPGSRETINSIATTESLPISHIGRLTNRAQGVTMLGATGRTDLPRFDSDEVVRVL